MEAVNATLTSYSSQIHLNVIFPSRLGTFECFLVFMYSNEKFVSFLTSLMGGIYIYIYMTHPHYPTCCFLFSTT